MESVDRVPEDIPGTFKVFQIPLHTFMVLAVHLRLISE